MESKISSLSLKKVAASRYYLLPRSVLLTRFRARLLRFALGEDKYFTRGPGPSLSGTRCTLTVPRKPQQGPTGPGEEVDTQPTIRQRTFFHREHLLPNMPCQISPPTGQPWKERMLKNDVRAPSAILLPFVTLACAADVTARSGLLSHLWLSRHYTQPPPGPAMQRPVKPQAPEAGASQRGSEWDTQPDRYLCISCPFAQVSSLIITARRSINELAGRAEGRAGVTFPRAWAEADPSNLGDISPASAARSSPHRL